MATRDLRCDHGRGEGAREGGEHQSNPGRKADEHVAAADQPRCLGLLTTGDRMFDITHFLGNQTQSKIFRKSLCYKGPHCSLTEVFSPMKERHRSQCDHHVSLMAQNPESPSQHPEVQR